MRKAKFELIETTCKRCGKKLFTGNRSLYGFDEQKKRLDRLCGDCITPKERQELLSLVPFPGCFQKTIK
jgi:ribosomal protein L32